MYVVFLGTGTPRPDPNRQGPSLAIVANGKAYIVDAGTGIVRQAAAAYRNGIKALLASQLDIAFLTHLHSDHTLGLPDLILTPWVMHRTVPLQLYGPAGTQAMADNIEKAYTEDIQVRIEGLEHQTTTGHQVVVHEIQPGVVYQDTNVKVTAFAVAHGSWKEALGYRFDADGKSMVISGDTRPVDSVAEACDGCDMLVHEVYSGRQAMREMRRTFPLFILPHNNSEQSRQKPSRSCWSSGITCRWETRTKRKWCRRSIRRSAARSWWQTTWT